MGNEGKIVCMLIFGFNQLIMVCFAVCTYVWDADLGPNTLHSI